MSNLHRVQWIDSQIRSRRFPNCTDIAREFCISKRQASRDVEYLRYSLGAPVAFDTGRNGYYYTDELFSLPGIMIGSEEKKALSFLAREYSTSGGELAGQLAELFQRLSGRTGTKESVTLPVYKVDSKLMSVIRQIRQALETHQKVEIHYLSSGQERSTRVVHPLLIFRKQQRHYLAAWCEFRGAERCFRLDRIFSVKTLKNFFDYPRWFNPRKYDEEIRFNFRLPYEAEVEFDRDIIPPAGEHCYSRGAAHRFRITFESSSRLFAELISLNTGFTIVAPAWLRKKCIAFFS
ncbi:MAG: WYL domain-containing protein, partial [Spirochaetales bacterium]|nr:WYL domain-containing protein [Spirochaetales bacterium]